MTLKDLGTWRGGGTPSKANPAFWTNGTVPWISPKDMKVLRITDSQDKITEAAVVGSATTRIPAHSVAVVTRSGILERTLPVSIVEVDATINQDLKALTPSPNVDSAFVAYYLRGYEREVLDQCSKDGTTVASIDFTRLLSFYIPLPPLDEQKEIVAAIETQFARLDDAVAALERARTRLKRYRASVLKAACEGRLVPTEAELARQERRTYEPAADLLARIRANCLAPTGTRKQSVGADGTLPDANQSSLPEGWMWVKLGDLLREPLRNGHSARASNDGSGIPTLTLTAVTTGDFSERNVKLTTAEPERVADLWIEPGDIYVERSNTPELVGTARLFRGSSRMAVFPDLLIRVRINDELNPSFLESVLLEERARQYFKSRAQGIAGSMPKIDQGTIMSLPIPLAPATEQERIVTEVERRLSVLDRMEAEVNANLKRAKSLRQSILRRAFSGRLFGSVHSL